MKYYEIISYRHNDSVVGVCSDAGCENEWSEDGHAIFGEISYEDFVKYGDEPWNNPISEKKYFGKRKFYLEELE